MKKTLVFSLLLGFMAVQAMAGLPDSLFKGKTVAIYLSKKGFKFDEPYYMALSQFLKVTTDENGKIIEDLEVESLLYLGDRMAAELGNMINADSIYFLNKNPKLGRHFISQYNHNRNYLYPLDSTFEQTDMILVVNPWELGSYKRNIVYTRRNKIVTEQIEVKTSRIKVSLFEPVGGGIIAHTETCVDEMKIGKAEKLVDFNPEQESKAGDFLSRVFTLAMKNLVAGKKMDCPQEE